MEISVCGVFLQGLQISRKEVTYLGQPPGSVSKWFLREYQANSVKEIVTRYALTVLLCDLFQRKILMEHL